MEDIKQKPYFRLLLKEEKVIYDGIVWKRSVSKLSFYFNYLFSLCLLL